MKPENSVKKSGPTRDKRGRLSGGNPGNSGGKPGRSGRKPWAWRDAMRAALEQGRAHVVVQKIISGDIAEHLGDDEQGAPIIGETKNADRLKAIQFAAGYSEGVPAQAVEHTGDVIVRVVRDAD